MIDGTHSFSFSHTGMALLKDGKERGKVATYVESMRSNLISGLS